jgi:hypothetical protein
MGQQRPHVCALLSLCNALIHFGIVDGPWDQDSAEFQKMVKIAGAVHGSAIQENLDELAENWQFLAKKPCLTVDKYTALEMSKELVVKLLEKGMVVSLPIWDQAIGLHSVLIVGHAGGAGQRGHWFRVVNREPFTKNPVVNLYDWEVLGYRRWNIPVRVYGKAA